MTDPAPAKALSELFDGGTTVMLMTMIGSDHSSRPMTVAGVDGDRLSFLVDTTADWYAAVASRGERRARDPVGHARQRLRRAER